MGCNYLSMPLTPASGKTFPIWFKQFIQFIFSKTPLLTLMQLYGYLSATDVTLQGIGEMRRYRNPTKHNIVRTCDVMGLLPDTQNRGCACTGNVGNVFPRHRLHRKPLVSDPGMHHGTCVTHVPWWMSGSLTSGGGGNVPGIPGACATRNVTYLARGPLPWYHVGVMTFSITDNTTFFQQYSG